MAFANSNSKKSAPTIADLEADIAGLRREIASLAENLSAYGRDRAENYKMDIANMASDAVSSSMRAFNSARSEAAELEKDFEDRIRARPLQSVGLALGIGFLAALLHRRS